MAQVLILGGGFSGVVVAERLARTLESEHQITLVSRDDKFIFYPASQNYCDARPSARLLTR